MPLSVKVVGGKHNLLFLFRGNALQGDSMGLTLSLSLFSTSDNDVCQAVRALEEYCRQPHDGCNENNLYSAKRIVVIAFVGQ